MIRITIAALALAIAAPAMAQNFGPTAPNPFGYMPSPYEIPGPWDRVIPQPVFPPAAPLPHVTNCTSYRLGNSVETTCF